VVYEVEEKRIKIEEWNEEDEIGQMEDTLGKL